MNKLGEAANPITKFFGNIFGYLKTFLLVLFATWTFPDELELDPSNLLKKGINYLCWSVGMVYVVLAPLLYFQDEPALPEMILIFAHAASTFLFGLVFYVFCKIFRSHASVQEVIGMYSFQLGTTLFLSALILYPSAVVLGARVIVYSFQTEDFVRDMIDKGMVEFYMINSVISGVASLIWIVVGIIPVYARWLFDGSFRYIRAFASFAAAMFFSIAGVILLMEAFT